jgi:hypothetical protein
MNENTSEIYNHTFNKLMNSENPAITYAELIEAGNKFISADMLTIIDKAISNELAFMNTAILANPEDLLMKTKLMERYTKAKEIRNLFASNQLKQKVFQYNEIQWNIPFRELYHTVITVCKFAKPIYPNIEPLKYIQYFFTEIDFDKIENNNNKTETLKYCNVIYYGLEQLLKVDISKAINEYQNNISKLSTEQIQETQIQLIELIGNIKRQARTNQTRISFTQRYNALYKSIEAKEKLFSVDYQILISHFSETILNDLLSSFEIINETFKEITPLLKALPPQPTKTKSDTKLSLRQQALIRGYKGDTIIRGESLYKHRGLLQSKNRLAEPQNVKAYNDFRNDLLKVIENLEHPFKVKAIDELKTYETKYNNQFEKIK